MARINTNVPSMIAQSNLSKTNADLPIAPSHSRAEPSAVAPRRARSRYASSDPAPAGTVTTVPTGMIGDKGAASGARELERELALAGALATSNHSCFWDTTGDSIYP